MRTRRSKRERRYRWQRSYWESLPGFGVGRESLVNSCSGTIPAANLSGMSVNRSDENALQPQENLLLWALVVSLSAHLLLYGGFELGRKWGLWESDLLPFWLKSAKKTMLEIQKRRIDLQAAQQEVPLLFVEVDPATATPT